MNKNINIKPLQSTKNPLVKHAVLLTQKSKARRTHNLCVIEGKREVIRAIQQGYHFTHLFLYEASSDYTRLLDQIEATYNNHSTSNDEHPLFLQCSEAIFQKLAYRGTYAHIVGIAQQKNWSLKCSKF